MCPHLRNAFRTIRCSTGPVHMLLSPDAFSAYKFWFSPFSRSSSRTKFANISGHHRLWGSLMRGVVVTARRQETGIATCVRNHRSGRGDHRRHPALGRGGSWRGCDRSRRKVRPSPNQPCLLPRRHPSLSSLPTSLVNISKLCRLRCLGRVCQSCRFLSACSRECACISD